MLINLLMLIMLLMLFVVLMLMNCGGGAMLMGQYNSQCPESGVPAFYRTPTSCILNFERRKFCFRLEVFFVILVGFKENSKNIRL